MRVLFIGDGHESSTSSHRAKAFLRLGYEVMQLDPLRAFAARLRGNAGRFHYHTGYTLLRGAVLDWLRKEIGVGPTFDLCWVDGGEMLGANSVRLLRERCGSAILFNHDDPTGQRDWRRFYTLRSAISSYHRCAVVRSFNVDEFKAYGAQDVVRVYRTYDEVAHAAPAGHAPIGERFRSDVCFIGANYKGENRDYFLANLIDRGLKLAIWGDHWERSPVWKKLEPFHRGGNLTGSEYVDAIRGAKACLGLLAARNRDEHTTRSMEIPYAGGVLCAQRTPEHTGLYNEGSEALFWSNFEECYLAASRLVSDDALRTRIRERGMERVRKNCVGNESMIAKVVGPLSC